MRTQGGEEEEERAKGKEGISNIPLCTYEIIVSKVNRKFREMSWRKVFFSHLSFVYHTRKINFIIKQYLNRLFPPSLTFHFNIILYISFFFFFSFNFLFFIYSIFYSLLLFIIFLDWLSDILFSWIQMRLLNVNYYIILNFWD